MTLWMGGRVETDETAWLEPNADLELPRLAQSDENCAGHCFDCISIAEDTLEILLQLQ
jgi:hypothetical protein